MPRPKTLILRAPGTNCNEETAFAFQQAGAETETLHIRRVLENPKRFSEFQILVVPGGFSYGDDIAAGRILANQMRQSLAEHIRVFRDAGKLILGICNGFQVLIKAGVLVDDAAPTTGVDAQDPDATATLTWNESGKYEDRWVRLQADSSRCVFFHGVTTMYLPIAHAEGKFVARDAATLEHLTRMGQLPLRYLANDADRLADGTYPDNPNGSVDDVAAMCDATGRICGLMPHPERHIDPLQHPRWTRREESPDADGQIVFKNAVAYFK